jgi:hypothetical protein
LADRCCTEFLMRPMPPLPLTAVLSVILPTLAAWPSFALACGSCRPLVMARIAAQPFWPTLALLALPPLLLVLIAAAIYRGGARR